jgi:glycosyltransferase involved in cell wall biosynthesis
MIRVAVVAPHGDRCSIADYARLLAPHVPDDIELDAVPLPAPAASRAEWAAAKTRASAADVVHVHYETALFQSVKPWRNRYARFMRGLGPRRVVTLHDRFPPLEPRWRHRPYRAADLLRDVAYLPWFGRWEAMLFDLAEHYVVHTRALGDRVRAHRGDRCVSRLPMPVPRASARWAGPPPSAHLVSPGFIKPAKGYDDWLDVLPTGLDAHWTIAGPPQDDDDAAHLEALRQRIDSLGLAARVTITGYLPRDEMEALLAQASLAVLPFRRASGSSSVAWAVAVGLPVVATDLPAFRDMAEDGAGMELLPTDARDTWAARVTALLADPARLSALAAQNRRHAECCDFEHLAADYAAIYRRLAER